MKLQDIKPGKIIWNQWEYSIMGRDTGITSAYVIILEAGKITKNLEGKKGVTCRVKKFNTDKEEEMSFDEKEIDKGWLRMATKSELMKMKVEESGRIEKEILEHKTKIGVLEIELSEIDGKYQDFIDKAI